MTDGFLGRISYTLIFANRKAYSNAMGLSEQFMVKQSKEQFTSNDHDTRFGCEKENLTTYLETKIIIIMK